jgi:hypothetical protein
VGASCAAKALTSGGHRPESTRVSEWQAGPWCQRAAHSRFGPRGGERVSGPNLGSAAQVGSSSPFLFIFYFPFLFSFILNYFEFKFEF